jgi:hypothetical protein
MSQEKKPVRLLARVKARFRSGHYHVLSAIIRGTQEPAKELILVAHICHPKPSANDNASGCALLAEMARTLIVLQKRKILPPLKRSLRLLVLPEWRGTVPWLHKNRRRTKNMLAVVSLDMVGENQERCGSTLLAGSTHGVQQHYSGHLLERAFGWVADQKGPAKLRKDTMFRWKTEKYFGGTDHMPFVDPTIGVPGLYVGHPQDFFWHTDQDTLDKVDPNTLERVGAASLIFTFDLLNLAPEERDSLLAENYLAACGRLATVGRELVEKAQAFLPESKTGHSPWNRLSEDHHQRLEKIHHELEVEKEVLRSCAQGLRGKEKRALGEKAEALGELLNWQAEEIHGLLAEAYSRILDRYKVDRSKLRRRSAMESRADGLVPERLFQGPFPITGLMDRAARRDRQWLAENFVKLYQQRLMEIPFFYIDGKRTILRVAKKLEFEYGPVDLDFFIRYLEVLARAKLIRLMRA